ncbi:MAG: hypothetical protein JXA11_08480 [Phycisphaerae bacterium]|nr:hypothetical protein [Phycisphaerae bacterium]
MFVYAAMDYFSMYDDLYGQEGDYLPANEYLTALAGSEPHPDSVMAQALRMAADVAQIANEHNVRSMTPRDMIDMSRRLYLLGAISLPEYAIMSFQPHLHVDFNANAASYRSMFKSPARKRDYIDAWEKHLEFVQRYHPDPVSLALSKEILDLLQSFEPLGD